MAQSADSLAPVYQQFAKFLTLAVATHIDHVGDVDSVYTSGTELGVDEQYNEMRWLAASKILSVKSQGDTAEAVALITTVAHETDTGHGYTASYGIREDTAHWELVRDADDGRWKVNGDAVDGFGVWHVGRDIKWVNGSRAKALAAVDSIRRARGLGLVR